MVEKDATLLNIPVPRPPEGIEGRIDDAYELHDFDTADALLREAIEQEYAHGDRIDSFYRYALKHISAPFHKLLFEFQKTGQLSPERLDEASDIYAWATTLLDTSLDELTGMQVKEQTPDIIRQSKRLSGAIDEIIIFTIMAREFFESQRFLPIPATLESDKYGESTDSNTRTDLQIHDLLDLDENGKPKVIPIQIKHSVSKAELADYDPAIVLIGIKNIFKNQQVYGTESLARSLIREVKAMKHNSGDEKRINKASYDLLRTVDTWSTYKRKEMLKKANLVEAVAS